MKNKTLYLNWNGEQGLETIEEITQEKGQSRREFMDCVRQLKNEYNLMGMYPYISSRACKDWNNRE